MPTNLGGPYYLFVITDPPTDSPIGKVFEGGGADEDNNSLYLAPPLIIDPPPPSNLAVTGITLPGPATVEVGRPGDGELDRAGHQHNQPRAGHAGPTPSTWPPGPPGTSRTSTWARCSTPARSSPATAIPAR